MKLKKIFIVLTFERRRKNDCRLLKQFVMGKFFWRKTGANRDREEMGEISRTNTYQTRKRVIQGNVDWLNPANPNQELTNPRYWRGGWEKKDTEKKKEEMTFETTRSDLNIYFSSHHSFSLRTCSSSAGVKSFLMLNVFRISSGVLPLIMFATVLQVTSSRPLMSR